MIELPSRTLFTHFCLAFSHARQSRRISRFKYEVYNVYANKTSISSAVNVAWHYTRDIIFRHPRKWLHLTGCFWWCVHTYAGKVMRINFLLPHALAISCSRYLSMVIARTGPRWDIAMSRDLRYVTPLSSEKEQKDSIERNSQHFFLTYSPANVLIRISLWYLSKDRGHQINVTFSNIYREFDRILISEYKLLIYENYNINIAKN